MISIFVDTNVWFSAFYGSENCQKILGGHVRGKIKTVINQDVLTEIIRNVQAKAPNKIASLETFLRLTPPLIAKSSLQIPKKYRALADKKDLPILLSAHQIGVRIFVTGNTKDFDSKKIEKVLGIKILNPSETIKLLNL